MDPSILKELRHLIDANVISQDTATRIEDYYKARAAEPSNRFTIVLGILGALLVGLGIVLVIAHNWDSFGRPAKTMFAFLPLLVGQGLCIYTLWKRRDNFVWRESSAVILFFAIGSSISLISQIYHMGGLLSDLLFVWMLLAAPLIYIMPSYIVSMLYIAGVTWYASVLGYSFEAVGREPFLYFPMMLLVLPAYLKLLRVQNNLFVLHNWMIALSVAFTLGAFSGPTDFQWMFLGYLALACLYYQVGTGQFFSEQRLFANPFLVLAIPGILIALLPWTYQYIWTFDIFGSDTDWHWPFLTLTILMMVAIAAIFIMRLIRNQLSGVSPVEFSAFVFAGATVLSVDEGQLSSLLINVWVLILGLYFTRKGSRRHHLGILNLGLLIIALLAVLRFFDDSIPFVWRGIFFLATGIGFFAANYMVIRRKRSLALNKQA